MGLSVIKVQTYFRNMLSKVFNLEVSSVLSVTYESGLEVVVVSVVEAVEGAVDGAGDALALLVDESRDEGIVMIASSQQAAPPLPSASRRDGEYS